MDFFEVVRTRRSVRSYLDEDVSDGEVRRLLEAAILAPSAGNCQPWEFVIVRDKKRKEALSNAALGQRFVAEAPVVIVVCANVLRTAAHYGSRGANLYVIQDTAAATQNILLAATAMGLATCWVGAFDERRVWEILELPDEVRPLAIIPVGKSRRTPAMPPRIPLERVVHYEKW
ncbi:MAG: nitroreductase family protein [Candidatus Jordarchaeales archaeon]